MRKYCKLQKCEIQTFRWSFWRIRVSNRGNLPISIAFISDTAFFMLNKFIKQRFKMSFPSQATPAVGIVFYNCSIKFHFNNSHNKVSLSKTTAEMASKGDRTFPKRCLPKVFLLKKSIWQITTGGVALTQQWVCKKLLNPKWNSGKTGRREVAIRPKI